MPSDRRMRSMPPRMVSKLTLEYDGGEYAGWARQPGLRSVQEEMERALRTILGERGTDGELADRIGPAQSRVREKSRARSRRRNQTGEKRLFPARSCNRLDGQRHVFFQSVAQGCHTPTSG